MRESERAQNEKKKHYATTKAFNSDIFEITKFISKKYYCFKTTDSSPADVLGVGSVTDAPVMHMKIFTELR